MVPKTVYCLKNINYNVTIVYYHTNIGSTIYKTTRCILSCVYLHLTVLISICYLIY